MTGIPPETGLPHIDAPARHAAGLRDGTHGEDGDTVSLAGKERHFERAVELLRPHAVRVLAESDRTLPLRTAEVTASGVVRAPDGGLEARWAASWPEQRDTGVDPVTLLLAYCGSGFHHPHLRGATVRDWPLNVFTSEQAAAEIPVPRAIAAGDLHDLVFRSDYRIVPAIARPSRA